MGALPCQRKTLKVEREKILYIEIGIQVRQRPWCAR